MDVIYIGQIQDSTSALLRFFLSIYIYDILTLGTLPQVGRSVFVGTEIKEQVGYISSAQQPRYHHRKLS